MTWEEVRTTPIDVLAIGSTLLLVYYATWNLLLALAFRPSLPVGREPNPEKVVVLVPVRDDPSIFYSHTHLVSMDYPSYEVVICDDSADVTFSDRLQTLSGGRTHVLRRTEHVGRKSGALNYALDSIEGFNPKFVVIFDADHRPPPDFLRKAVAAIEEAGVRCVCGYQKHDVGAYGIFGRFYRASHAAAIMNFRGRRRLGLPSLFGGGAGIFDYAWLRRKKFDATSITEDWELSLRGYLDGDLSLEIREDLWTHAAVPKGYKWFVTQQRRWSEGTVSDFRKHFWSLVRSDRLRSVDKFALGYQGLYYTISIPFLLSIPLVLLGVAPIPLWLSVPLLLYMGISWAIPYARACRFEGFSRGESGVLMAYAFILCYALAPLLAYSTLRGALVRRQGWIVTRRRG